MDEQLLRAALVQARLAYQLGEVPVGAVIARGGEVLAAAHNRMEADGDATAHAELLCIREASGLLGMRLNDCTLYSTLEPCAMCVGAALLARIPRIVFGAFDARAGCCGSVMDFADGWFGCRAEVIGGILQEACSELLLRFFEERRKNASC